MPTSDTSGKGLESLIDDVLTGKLDVQGMRLPVKIDDDNFEALQDVEDVGEPNDITGEIDPGREESYNAQVT